MSKETNIGNNDTQQDMLISLMGSSQADFLTEQDYREIDEFVKQIKITNSNLVLTYGDYYQRNIANLYSFLSEVILVNNESLSDINDLEKSILRIIDTFIEFSSREVDSASVRERSIKDKRRILVLKSKLESIRLDSTIATEKLRKSYSEMFDFFRIIYKYIIAGEKKSAQIKKILKDYDDNKESIIKTPEDYYFVTNCNKSFIKRLQSLKDTLASCQLYLIQIKQQIEKNENAISICEKLIYTTIPAFEQSVTLH